MGSPEPSAFTVGERDAGQRLDRFLAERMAGPSRSAIGRMVRGGAVSVNDALPRKVGVALETGDVVVVRPAPDDGHSPPPAASPPASVLYDDDHMLAIDKPAGIAVHPGPGHPVGTLVDRLLALGTPLSRSGGGERPGIVHRLDKETSGAMLIAKNDDAHARLAAQFAGRSVRKTYVALLRGRLGPDEGLVDAPIGRDPGNRQRMAVVTSGREARTGFTVAGRTPGHSLVIARPQTGRPHQIRVHFASVGHPVAGDAVYGGRQDRGRGGGGGAARRMFLHSLRLEFAHPVSTLPVAVEAPLPPDLDAVLREVAEADYDVLMERVAAAGGQ